MSNALVKINKEAKRIQKKHPKKHRNYAGFRKEATERYHAGKIGKRKRSGSAKKKTHRKKSTHRKRTVHHKRTGAVGRVKHVRRRKHSTRKRHKGRKVGATKKRQSSGGGISTNKLLLLGGLAVGAYLLLKPKSDKVQLPAGAPPLVTTTNPVRNTQANDILTYAAAGGLAIDAIIKLINSLNSSSDSDVQAVHDNINSGGGIPDVWIA